MIETPQRSFLSQIFISPDEPRLRAGWRLLIYSIVWFIASNVIAIPFGMIAMFQYMATNPELDMAALTAQITNMLTFVGHPMTALIYVASGATVLLVTWLARRFMDRRSFVSLGLHRDRYSLPDLAFGLGLGALLMALIYG